MVSQATVRKWGQKLLISGLPPRPSPESIIATVQAALDAANVSWTVTTVSGAGSSNKE